MMLLTVHEIGRTGHSDSTVTTVHTDHHAATLALYARFGTLYIRGGADSGTAGSPNGRVFQASHVWTIREVKEVKR